MLDLDGIYAAVGDEAAFQQLPSQVAAACGTRSAVVVGLAPAGTSSFLLMNYWDEAFAATYQEHFLQVDPWTETAITVGRFGRAAALDLAMSPEAFLRTAMYNDLFRTHGDDTGRCLGVMPALGREGLMMAIHRAGRDDAFTDRDEQRLDEVYGHVHRVVSLRKAFALERDKAANLEDMINQTGNVILRVDRNLRVVALSAAAERLLEKRDGVGLRNQRIALPVAIEAQLKMAVAATMDRTSQAPTALLCPRPSGRRPYRFRVLPAGFDGGSGALLRIDDPDETPGPDWQSALRDSYGFSSMEADLAARLHAEHSLDEIAAQRGVTRETLRTQLKALFHKTGVTRQSALIKLLATFPTGRGGG